MVWLRTKNIVFDYTLLSGGPGIYGMNKTHFFHANFVLYLATYVCPSTGLRKAFISFYSEIFTFSKQGFNESIDFYICSILMNNRRIKYGLLYLAILYVLRKLFPKNSKSKWQLNFKINKISQLKTSHFLLIVFISVCHKMWREWKPYSCTVLYYLWDTLVFRLFRDNSQY